MLRAPRMVAPVLVAASGCSDQADEPCGNAVLDPGEECDDPADTDELVCRLDCTKAFKTAFITSQAYNGLLGGLEGADDRCQQLATEAGLTGTYRAWLSTEDESPSTRFVATDRPYAHLAGLEIAADFAALTSGSLANNLNIDEDGFAALEPVEAWTNTRGDGTPTGADCNGWDSLGSDGAFGDSGLTDESWTRKGAIDCTTSLRLYCFEQ